MMRYKDITPGPRQYYRSTGNAGLQLYYLAAKITTLEETLAMGKTCYQIEGSQRSDFMANQVEEQPEVTELSPPSS